MPFILEPADPAKLGFRPEVLDRLCAIIQRHIDDNRYPGAQIAVARHGRLALDRTFGAARIEPERVPANDRTLWRIYSNTKVITATAIWLLVEDGALTFHDRVADHIPDFARHGKGEITVHQLLTHRAGFPLAGMELPAAAYEDHELMCKLVCDFTLEWTPGSRVRYHHLAAHWAAAALIEQLSGEDFRAFIRSRVIEPLGLSDDMFVGLPDSEEPRAADVHQSPDGVRHERYTDENTQTFRRAGVPGSGGMATARAIAAYYQMMVAGGTLGGKRLLSPRMVQYVTRDFTGDEIDHFGGIPMHRGLGPHSRGLTEPVRGLGTLASPRTFGHGGVGTSYCWGDPDSGVSLAYVSNSRLPDAWNFRRWEIISNCVHAAIGEL